MQRERERETDPSGVDRKEKEIESDECGGQVDEEPEET